MENLLTMDMLSVGESARVISLNITGEMRRRFCDLGLIEGTVIKCVGKSPLGDPSAYLIRGAVIALRCEDVREIVIKPV